MAVPLGNFYSGVAGIAAPGGAFTYGAGLSRPRYFGGTFIIDTGYDDPTGYSATAPAAELYLARVYSRGITINPAVSTGVAQGDWVVEAVPSWGTSHVQGTAVGSNGRRVYLVCRAFLLNPVSNAEGSYQRINSVDWALFRA